MSIILNAVFRGERSWIAQLILVKFIKPEDFNSSCCSYGIIWHLSFVETTTFKAPCVESFLLDSDLLSQLLEATSDWKFKRKMSPAKRLFDVLMHMHYISTKGWFELLFEFSGHLIVWELSLLRFWILVSSYRLTVTFPKILVGWCAFISCLSKKY